MGNHKIIKEARCSFPRLYGAEIREGDTFGPGITLVLEREKHSATLADIRAEMRSVIASEPKLKSNPPTGDKLCLRQPDRDELKYKEGNLILKANAARAPVVLEADGRTVMSEATNKIYSGCYVNAKVEIWGQVNKYGKRVNAKLIAVQFVPKEADSFDGSYVAPEEAVKGFDALEDTTPALGLENITGDQDTSSETDDILG